MRIIIIIINLLFFWITRCWLWVRQLLCREATLAERERAVLRRCHDHVAVLVAETAFALTIGPATVAAYMSLDLDLLAGSGRPRLNLARAEQTVHDRAH